MVVVVMGCGGGVDVAKGISSQMNVFHAGQVCSAWGAWQIKHTDENENENSICFLLFLFSSAAFRDVLCVLYTLSSCHPVRLTKPL